MNKVYEGGLPTGGFSTNLSVSSEGEFGQVPGKADAANPKFVNEGGRDGGKSYDKKASEDFLGDDSYHADSAGLGDWTSMKMDIDNPDTLSHADYMDDEDFKSK